MCVARVHTHCCARRRRGKLAKQAQGENQTEKGSEERWRKRGGHTNTKGAEFYTIVCWRETKKPNPTSTVVQLTNCDSITGRIHRTASSTRDGDVGRESVSGKSGNAQSDVRAVQSKNGRREINQKAESGRERACVWHGCANTVATGESEAS